MKWDKKWEVKWEPSSGLGEFSAIQQDGIFSAFEARVAGMKKARKRDMSTDDHVSRKQFAKGDSVSYLDGMIF